MTSDYEKEGMEALAAGVLKSAYMDLIEARLADAAYQWHDGSYNCNQLWMYYAVGKMRYCRNENGAKQAKRDIEKWEKWFRSPRCRIFCKNVSGQWFIDTARKKARDFSLDLIPPWQAKPSFENGKANSGNNSQRKRDLAEWRKDRDAWRKEHGLKEVKDEL
jgi:hypothetical protein